MNKGTFATFILTLISFATSVAVITVPPFTELLSGSPPFLLPFGIFFFLSAALFIMAYKGNLSGRLRGFLLLTGGSGAGVFLCILLHNFIYGLFIYAFGEGIWGGVGGDEPFFFILGLIVCPIGYVVGSLGTLYLTFTTSGAR
ncbi:hypothetical protein KGY64_02140 [Candidatus Bipolaricaulota bacterium]|nr:hypothetical protein [Candidatus Bipolaricaulota bacterium]